MVESKVERHVIVVRYHKKRFVLAPEPNNDDNDESEKSFLGDFPFYSITP